MNSYSKEDVREVAELVLEMENRYIRKKAGTQDGKVAAYGKYKIDADAVSEILEDILKVGSK